MRRVNPHDKFLLTVFPDRRQDGTFDDEFDFCSWRIPDEENYGAFFVCFAGQHEIGGNTERNHIQLFIKTKRRHRYNEIIARLGLRNDQLHIDPVFRTPEKAWDYCTENKPSSDEDGEEIPNTRHGCVTWTFGQYVL